MKAILLRASGVSVAAVLIAAGPVLASGNSSGASSITLTGTTVAGVASPTLQPALGATAWFSEQYPKTAKNPVIESDCYQNGVIVWGEVDTVTSANSIGVLLGGNSSPWIAAGGSASCVEILQSRVFKGGGEVVTDLAQTSFTAAG